MEIVIAVMLLAVFIASSSKLGGIVGTYDDKYGGYGGLVTFLVFIASLVSLLTLLILGGVPWK